MRCVLSDKETDQCSNIHQDCKHCDQGLDIFLHKTGVKLLAPQRELLREYIKNDKRVYVMPARFQGRTYLKTMLALTETILKGE